jgi:4-amino-4-deoxy-L-arabinose transferase-like glycosyltransferase
MTARIALIGLLCVAWILPGLIGHDPWKPDEAYSFGLIYHIIRHGDWVVPMLAGQPFLEKPPRYYLTAAAFAKTFSPPLALHDAARLASGFYMAIVFLFTGFAGRELFGKGHGAAAVLLLVGAFGLLIRSHQMVADIALLAGFAITYYALALAPRRWAAGGFWLGIGGGVSFMSGDLLAPCIVGIIIVLLPIAFRTWRSRRYAAALGIALIVCLPWLVIWPAALYQRSPELFEQWLWIDNLDRFIGINPFGPTFEHLFYLRILPWYAWPLWPFAAWTLWRTRSTGFMPGIQLALLGFLVTLIVLSAVAGARELYGLPLLVPLALLAVPATDTLRRGAANAFYWFGAMTFSFFVIVAWFYWVALEFGVPGQLQTHLNEMQPGYTNGFRLLPFAIGLLFTVVWITVLRSTRKSRMRPLIVWAAGITILWGVLNGLFLGWVNTGKSYRTMIASLEHKLPAHYHCIASRSLGEPQRALLDYYAGITTQRAESPGHRHDCDLLLIQGDPDYPPLPGEQWKELWDGARPGDDSEHFWLYQRRDRRAE